jgi:hypothetical protein
MTDYTNRRIDDESASCRLPPGPVDFVAVNNSKRRNRRRADRLQFDTLRDERTGYENRLLFNFLLTFGSLVDRGIGEHRSGKHAGRHQNYSAFRYRHLHKQELHPGSCGVQIIEAMTMIPSPQQQERQWLLPLPLPRPNHNVSVRISSLGGRKRTVQWHRK